MEASCLGPENRRKTRINVVLTRVIQVPILFLISILFCAVLFSGTAAAQTYTNPHGGFSNTTQLCQICHAQHEAPGSKLVRGTPESALCFTCHNGTGSNYNIETQMNQNPALYAMHPIHVGLANNNGSYSYLLNTTAGIAPPGPYSCSQCHNPHGEIGFGRLLRNHYETADYVTYTASPNPYDACWSCHNSVSILNDSTYFNRHNSHIINDQAPCTACHYSPHGVPASDLVRFNPRFVTKSIIANSGPTYTDGGNHTGSCTLSCHGYDHNNSAF